MKSSSKRVKKVKKPSDKDIIRDLMKKFNFPVGTVFYPRGEKISSARRAVAAGRLKRLGSRWINLQRLFRNKSKYMKLTGKKRLSDIEFAVLSVAGPARLMKPVDLESKTYQNRVKNFLKKYGTDWQFDQSEGEFAMQLLQYVPPEGVANFYNIGTEQVFLTFSEVDTGITFSWLGDISNVRGNPRGGFGIANWERASSDTFLYKNKNELIEDDKNYTLEWVATSSVIEDVPPKNAPVSGNRYWFVKKLAGHWKFPALYDPRNDEEYEGNKPVSFFCWPAEWNNVEFLPKDYKTSRKYVPKDIPQGLTVDNIEVVKLNPSDRLKVGNKKRRDIKEDDFSIDFLW